MSVYTEAAKKIVRDKRESLKQLDPGKRLEVVQEIVGQLQTKSEDEVISFLSKGKQEVDPKLQEKLDTYFDDPNWPEDPEEPGDYEDPTPEEIALERKSGALGRLENRAELQSIGVSTDEPLPGGDLELGFGADPADALRSALTKEFGQPATVFRRKDQVLYLDPTDNVVKQANPNVLGLIGQGLPIAGDVTGTVGGGMLGALALKSPGGAVVGESFGSAIGTGTGEFTRLVIGKAMGTHNLTYAEMAEQSGIKGLEAGAATGITGGVLTAIKGVRNFLNGYDMTKEAALRAGLSDTEATAAIEEVNKLVTGETKVKGTMFTTTQDVEIGAAEAEIRSGLKYKAKYLERDLNDQQALTEALDTVNPQGANSGIVVQEAIEKQLKNKLDTATKIVSKNVSELDTQLSALSKMNKESVGEPTRDLLIAKTEAAQKAQSQTWEEVKQVGRFNEQTKSYGIEIPVGENTLKLKGELDDLSKVAWTSYVKSGAGKVFAKEPVQKQAQDTIKTLKRGNVRFRDKPEPVERPLSDLNNVNDELSKLRKEIRKARRNSVLGEASVGDLEKVERAIVADRKLAMVKSGKGDLLQKIEAAEKQTNEYYRTYKRSIVGSLTQKNDNGTYYVQSKNFVDELIGSDPRDINKFADVISDNPDVMMKWKQGLGNAYKREVVDKINPEQGTILIPAKRKRLREASKQWIEENKEALTPFFTKTELKNLEKTGDLAVLVKKQEGQYSRMLENARKKWGRGKLTSIDPQNLVKFATNNSGNFSTPIGRGVQAATSKIQYVKNMLRREPAAWKRFQDDFSSQLRADIVDAETGIINPTVLSEWVSTKSEAIKLIHGEQYLKDLQTINKVSQLLSKQPKKLGSNEVQAGVIQTVRGGLAPPLTRRGRLFTALLIFDRKRGHDVVSEALLDPTKLRDIAKLAKHKTFNRQALELAISIGLIENLPEEF